MNLESSEGADTHGLQPADKAIKLVQRYIYTYRLADALHKGGEVVKLIGLAIGVGWSVIWGFLWPNDVLIICAGVVIGVFMAVACWVAGLLACAASGMLRVMIDTAVNTSPFLDSRQKAETLH